MLELKINVQTVNQETLENVTIHPQLKIQSKILNLRFSLVAVVVVIVLLNV